MCPYTPPPAVADAGSLEDSYIAMFKAKDPRATRIFPYAEMLYNANKLTADDVAAFINDVLVYTPKIADDVEKLFSAPFLASVFNSDNLTVSKVASIFNHANLSASKIASICDSPNITSAKLKAILDTGVFTDADKIGAILGGDSLAVSDAVSHIESAIYTDDLYAGAFNSTYLSVAKAVSIFDNVNLSVSKAVGILRNSNLSHDKALDIYTGVSDTRNTEFFNTTSVYASLSNPGFETSPLADWTKDIFDTSTVGGDIVEDTATVHSGTYSAKCTGGSHCGDADREFQAKLYQTFDLTNVRYLDFTVGGWIYTAAISSAEYGVNAGLYVKTSADEALFFELTWETDHRTPSLASTVVRVEVMDAGAAWTEMTSQKILKLLADNGLTYKGLTSIEIGIAYRVSDGSQVCYEGNLECYFDDLTGEVRT